MLNKFYSQDILAWKKYGQENENYIFAFVSDPRSD